MGQTLSKENCHVLNEDMRGNDGMCHDVYMNDRPKKGIYPYEYIKAQQNFTDITKIMKETTLPSHGQFYLTLNQNNISENDYKLVQQNRIYLKCKNMKDYAMKYLKLDVCILADLFENFKSLCLNMRLPEMKLRSFCC